MYTNNRNKFPDLSNQGFKSARYEYYEGKPFDLRYLPSNQSLQESIQKHRIYIELLNDNNLQDERRARFEGPLPSDQAIAGPATGVTKRLFPSRKLLISNIQYQHLVDLIHGGVYGPPERPDLESFVVGVGARIPVLAESTEQETIDPSGQHLIHDESNGQGFEIIYDTNKQVFILCEEILDQLVLLAWNDFDKASQVSKCITRFGVYEIDFVDDIKQRVFESFINREIKPLLSDTVFIQGLVTRVMERRSGSTHAIAPTIAATTTRRQSV